MKFVFAHTNYNVADMAKAVAFYKDVLGLSIVREKTSMEGAKMQTFLGDDTTGHQIELTWFRDHDQKPYDLGENQDHLAFFVNKDEYMAAYEKHKEMGIVTKVFDGMVVYFIKDPDGHQIEIIPK